MQEPGCQSGRQPCQAVPPEPLQMVIAPACELSSVCVHVQHVAKDIQTQQQFLDQFLGGQKAQLSWFVQLIAEQLSWGDAEHVSVTRCNLVASANHACTLMHSHVSWDTMRLDRHVWPQWSCLKSDRNHAPLS